MFEKFALGIASTVITAVGGPYYTEQTYDIPEGESVIVAPAPFTSVTLFSPSGEELPEIYYEDVEGEFKSWEYGETNDNTPQGEEHDERFLSLLMIDEPVMSVRIRAETKTQVTAHFFNTERPLEDLSVAAGELLGFAPLGNYAPAEVIKDIKNAPKSALRPRFISRSDWGADESLRYWSPTRGHKKFFRSSVPEAELADESEHPRIVARSEDGNRLTWPIEENRVVKKFIVHHTGEYVDNRDRKRDSMQIMRAIYSYHTITRGWGDIGYNYVIDKEGNIYEGRAGGPSTVGAHTAYYNLGTVGISLMGNFVYEEPTPAQLAVLKILIADHAERFNVDPEGKSEFLGIDSYNVSGHRDVARQGHGTACPGPNLHEKLPEIRRDAKLIMKVLRDKGYVRGARDFLAQSEAAPDFLKQRRVYRRSRPTTPPLSVAHLLTAPILQRGETRTVQVNIKNGSSEDWPTGTELVVRDVPEGMELSNFKSIRPIAAGSSGVFRATARIEDTPNGRYSLGVTPQFLNTGTKETQDFEKYYSFEFPIQVSGSRALLTQKNPGAGNKMTSMQDFLKASSLGASREGLTTLGDDRVEAEQARQAVARREAAQEAFNEVTSTFDEDTKSPPIKIKLSYFDENYAVFAADTPLRLVDRDGVLIATILPGHEVRVVPQNQSTNLEITTQGRRWELPAASLITDGVIEVTNYDRGLGTNAYNHFRRKINIHRSGEGGLLLVNELPLEEYLWGLAEEPSTEPDEKKHAIHVLARSYGLVYSQYRRKFGTNLYDLEDSPATSQMYLGYDWERYHALQKKLVKETRGEVITYNGNPVIGPYFTQSAGQSLDIWMKQYPWTKGRELPYDKGLEQKGHGVGLSGNSARVLAEQGKTYTQILDYFYEGIEVEKVY